MKLAAVGDCAEASCVDWACFDSGVPCKNENGVSDPQIEESVTTARDPGSTHLVLLHHISAYPAPMDQANLR